MPTSKSLGHIHLFVCKRSPEGHCVQASCVERLVICPMCGSAGRMVRVEMEVA